MKQRRLEHGVRPYLTSFVFVGLAANMAGPALSYLRDRAGTDNGGIAVVFVTQAIGYIAGSLLAGRVLDRGKGHALISWSLAGGSGAVLGVALSHSVAPIAGWFFVLGVALGLIDVSGNTLVVWSRPGRSDAVLNALHLLFAVGALSAPVIIDRALAWSHSLWPLLVPLGGLTVACTGVLNSSTAPVRTRLPMTSVDVLDRPRQLQLAGVCLFFFCYVGVETGFAGWIHSYVEQIRYGGPATATGVTATFWLGFAVGRGAAVWIATRATAAQMLTVSVLGTVVAAVGFWVFEGPGAMLWVTTFVFAVSVAPQYASMMAFAETRLALSGGSTAALVASSGLGVLVLPWLLGQLFDGVGPQALPPTIAIGSIVVAASAVVVAWVLPTGQRPPATSMKAPVT